VGGGPAYEAAKCGNQYHALRWWEVQLAAPVGGLGCQVVLDAACIGVRFVFGVHSGFEGALLAPVIRIAEQCR
jgi:hypothetical protein